MLQVEDVRSDSEDSEEELDYEDYTDETTQSKSDEGKENGKLSNGPVKTTNGTNRTNGNVVRNGI